jgi:hypothetical protein
MDLVIEVRTNDIPNDAADQAVIMSESEETAARVDHAL